MSPNTDLSKVLTIEHEGKWVALSDDRRSVIDFSPDLLELRKRVGESNEDVVYMKVLPADMEFAFF